MAIVRNTPLYDSARRPSAMIEEAAEILRYRNLVLQFVRRDVVTRYKRSVLGVAWTMLNPLGMMLVMTVVFSQLFQSTRAYPAYLLTGLIAWNFFSQTTLTGMRNLVWGGLLIQRIYIPKTLFAFSSIGTGLVNLLLSLIPLALVMMLTGVWFHFTALLLPLAIFLLAVFALGMGLLLSTIAVYFPDVAEMYEIALAAWMYLTPIIYPEEIIAAPLRWWLTNLNPMYHLIKLFRLALYDNALPSIEQLAAAVLAAFVVLLAGWFVFTRKADEFAYRI